MVNFITNKPAIPANSTHVPLGCIDTFVEYQMFCSRYFQCCVRHQVCAFNSRARKFNRILLLWKCNCTLQKLTYVTKRLNLTKKEVITTNDLILLCNIYAENIYFWEVRDLCTILLSWGDFYAMMKFTICLDITFIDGYVKNFINKSKTNQHRQENEIPISEGVTSVCPEKCCNVIFWSFFCQSTIYNNKKTQLLTNKRVHIIKTEVHYRKR